MGSDPVPFWQTVGFFRVGDYLVRPSLKSIRLFLGFDNLSAAEDDIRVPDKAMAILLLMAERPREVCSREYLLDAVWGPHRDTYDRVLDNAIREIRKAFDDSARDSRYIETIPKKGYRLIAEVEWPSPPNDGEGEGLSGPAPANTRAFLGPHHGLPPLSGDRQPGEPAPGPAPAESDVVPERDGEAAPRHADGAEASSLGSDPVAPGPAPGDRPTAAADPGTRDFADDRGRSPEDGDPATPPTATAGGLASGFDAEDAGTTESVGAAPSSEPEGELRTATADRGGAAATANEPERTPTERPRPGPVRAQEARVEARRPVGALRTTVLTLVLVLTGLALAWALFRDPPELRLRFEAAENHTWRSDLDELHLLLADRLRGPLPCGRRHIDTRASPSWGAHRITLRIHDEIEGLLRLELASVGSREGLEEPAPGQRPLYFDGGLAPSRIAAGAADVYLGWVDLRLCTGSDGAEGGSAGRGRPGSHHRGSHHRHLHHRHLHCLAAARRAIEEHRLERAESLLARAIEADPEPFEPHLLLARTRVHLGRSPEAVEHLGQARDRAQNPAHRRAFEVRIAEIEGRYGEARALLEAARSEAAGNGGLDARWRGELGRWLLVHERRCRTARKHLLDAIEGPDPDRLLLTSEARLACGRGAQAIAGLRAYQENDPTSVRAATALARALRLTGDHDGAEQKLRQALRLEPGSFPALLERARLEVDQGDLEEADRCLDRALANARWPPDEARAHVARADLHLRRRQPAAALEQSQKALQLDPESALAWWIDGRARVDLGQMDEARDRAEWIREKRGERGTRHEMEYHHHLLAVLAHVAGRTDEALQSLASALELYPSDRAFYLAEAGDVLTEAAGGSGAARREALERYRQALEVNPEHAPALCGAARIASLEGDRDQARVFYRRAEAVLDAGTKDLRFVTCLADLRALESSFDPS